MNDFKKDYERIYKAIRPEPELVQKVLTAQDTVDRSVSRRNLFKPLPLILSSLVVVLVVLILPRLPFKVPVITTETATHPSEIAPEVVPADSVDFISLQSEVNQWLNAHPDTEMATSAGLPALYLEAKFPEGLILSSLGEAAARLVSEYSDTSFQLDQKQELWPIKGHHETWLLVAKTGELNNLIQKAEAFQLPPVSVSINDLDEWLNAPATDSKVDLDDYLLLVEHREQGSVYKLRDWVNLEGLEENQVTELNETQNLLWRGRYLLVGPHEHWEVFSEIMKEIK